MTIYLKSREIRGLNFCYSLLNWQLMRLYRFMYIFKIWRYSSIKYEISKCVYTYIHTYIESVRSWHDTPNLIKGRTAFLLSNFSEKFIYEEKELTIECHTHTHTHTHIHFLWSLSLWRIHLQHRRLGFDSWVKKIPWRSV